ncbi:MAG: DUF4364 family protein [Defluviitaleaceae bacterium]|nr:DUF4364 family protein [Defluviitaleaceae bacterium]MCL2240606.1 DUF4364 family protein [Defluviitaleaceae bacterium]
MTEQMKDYEDVENKLIILYLINRMVLPMSNGQITDILIGGELMDYYTLQQNLSEMVDIGLLESTQENAMDNNTTRFTATEDGANTLEFFERRITLSTRQAINRYANENRQKIKKDYEKTATYFPDEENDEFRVKCGIYEDERALLELSIFVDTREQAKLIQSHWRTNPGVYRKILEVLTTAEPAEDSPDSGS